MESKQLIVRQSPFPSLPKHPMNGVTSYSDKTNVDHPFFEYMWYTFPLFSLCSFLLYWRCKRVKRRVEVQQVNPGDYAAIHIERNQNISQQIPQYQYGFLRKKVNSGWVTNQEEV